LYWTLPEGDDEFSTRWRQIKAAFSRRLPKIERRSESRLNKGERGIWQRRFWEHAVRDDQDFQRHVDYIHYNPIKHGYVTRVADWQFSSFHRFVQLGIYPSDWAGEGLQDMDSVGMECDGFRCASLHPGINSNLHFALLHAGYLRRVGIALQTGGHFVRIAHVTLAFLLFGFVTAAMVYNAA
jgi:hypothetical protein